LTKKKKKLGLAKPKRREEGKLEYRLMKENRLDYKTCPHDESSRLEIYHPLRSRRVGRQKKGVKRKKRRIRKLERTKKLKNERHAEALGREANDKIG
jgi:hypothetical protein